MKEFIERIYNNTIATILNGFSIEEQEEIKEGYKKYLETQYSVTYEAVLDNIEKAIAIFSDVENKLWINKSKEEKQSYFIEDKALDSLKELSGIALKYAVDRLTSEKNNTTYEGINMDEMNKSIDEMKIKAEQVKQFNADYAMSLLSEGILDYNYAAKNSDNMSFRVSHMR